VATEQVVLDDDRATAPAPVAEGEEVGGILEPTDRKEITCWYLYDWCVARLDANQKRKFGMGGKGKPSKCQAEHFIRLTCTTSGWGGGAGAGGLLSSLVYSAQLLLRSCDRRAVLSCVTPNPLIIPCVVDM
jgi:hypothetical protein